MLLTATPTSANPMTFPEFLDEVISRGTSVRSSKDYALDHGVNEAALIRYANGAVSASERSEIGNVVAKCDWARTYVVNYVKSKRGQRQAA